MSIFRPDCCFDSVLQITPDFLTRHGLKGLALDMDNTLTPHRHARLKPSVAAWLAALREQGFKLAVVSNAREKRVAAFCAPLGLPYISDAGKPLSRSYRRAARLLGLQPHQLCMVGDQVFTDIGGAKRSGFYAIRVNPVALHNPFFRARNWLEKLMIQKSGGGTR